MADLKELKQRLAWHINEEAIFKGQPITHSDCDTCPHAKECEIDNPEFDANYCKVR